MRIRVMIRHMMCSRWTLLYLMLVIPTCLLAAWLVYEPIATLGYESVQTKGLSGPGMTLNPCKPIGSPRVVHCGVLEVFENRASRSGRKIPLNVVVAFAASSDRQPDPVFLIDGGPGVGKATIAGFSIASQLEFEHDRDLVFVDIRGTGASNPLSCVGFRGDPFKAATFLRSPGSYFALLSAQHYLEDPYDRDAMAECRRRIESRADLTQYTTTLAAADLDEVRDVLGYGRVNLSGTSYGSRLALEYIRRYPNRVRTASLSDIVPTDHRMPSSFARDNEVALQRLLEDCEADDRCRNAFPRLRRDLSDVLERLRAGAIKTTVPNPLLLGLEQQVRISYGAFAMGLRSMLYDWQGSALLPYVITRAASGDYGPLVAEIIDREMPLELLLAKGMYLSVTCSEDVAFIDSALAISESEGTVLGRYRLDQHLGACEIWPRGEVPDDWLSPVISDVPVLLISAELDPSTPPRTGREVVQHLSNGLLVVMRNETHGAEVNWETCGEPLSRQLLQTGTTVGLETSCATEIERAPFVITPDEV